MLASGGRAIDGVAAGELVTIALAELVDVKRTLSIGAWSVRHLRLRAGRISCYSGSMIDQVQPLHVPCLALFLTPAIVGRGAERHRSSVTLRSGWRLFNLAQCGMQCFFECDPAQADLTIDGAGAV